MTGSTDYMNGEKRLWAAEPLARGRAVCTETITGCSQGVPANPPMLYPSVRIRVNRERTKKIMDEISPRNWPSSDDEDLDQVRGD